MAKKEMATFELFDYLKEFDLETRINALCDGEFLGKFFEEYPEISEDEKAEIVDDLYWQFKTELLKRVWCF